MNRAHLILAFAFFLALAVPTGNAVGQATPPSFSTNPSPPPPDQQFSAVLRIHVNPWTIGFWEELPLMSNINGNVVEILFDTGCGFLCPPFDPEYQDYPFTMPALPAGNYVVRFVGAFGQPDPPYAQFDLAVGNGAQTAASLPVGGAWSILLAALLALFSGAWIRRVHQARRTIA